MITEDYVSFETAKLLKERGFDGVCRTAYETITNEHEVEQCSPSNWGELNQVKRPTLQMAMKWLREVHHVTIGITFSLDIITYEIQKDEEFIIAISSSGSYEDMVEEAIKICLEKLI